MTKREYFQTDLDIILVVPLLILLTLCVTMCTKINEKLGLDQDNPAEELFEDLIQSKTGLKVDLSPDSPE